MQTRQWLKKGLIMLAAVALMCASAVAESYPFYGVVTDQTNMRSSPSSFTSNVMLRIPEGDEVYVLNASGNFYRIQYDGKTGYVFQSYVKERVGGSANQGGFTATGYPYQTVTTSSVNLRKTASTSAKKLTTIPNNAAITVQQLSGSWAYVNYGSYTGWVVKDYIRVATIVPEAVQPDTGNDSPVENPGEGLSYQMLEKGSRGDQVVALQEALIELGFLSGSADGVFGAGTENAVKAFQRKNSYPITGAADANLQALIFNGKPLNSRGTKTEIKTLPVIDGVVARSGDQGVIVRQIQTALKEKGFYTGAISGTYDSKTVTAVKNFQKANGLTADGVSGEDTQKYLFAAKEDPTPTPTPSPSPVPSMAKPGSTVRKGSRGNDARLVQQRLIDLLYLDDKADGVFGSKSVEALKAFQRKHNLVADGVAGSGTNAVLFSWLAKPAQGSAPTQDPTPTPTPTPTPAPGNEEITKENVVTIRQDVVGSAVLRLQQRLGDMGYYVPVKDSICKKSDVEGIKAFQRKNGLTVDGIAGYDTQVLLYSDEALMADGTLAGYLKTNVTLKKGMTGEAVAALQQRLINLGYLTGTADGNFGTDTAEAVYYFQKASGLVRDSIAGESTLKRLFAADAKKNTAASEPTNNPTPNIPPATITTALMTLGDVNDSVKAMQQRLINLGYLTGVADGVFGNQTFRAVKEFQKANALTADGIAGKKTIEALLKSDNSAPEVTDSPDEDNKVTIMARSVKYEMWYSTVRNACRKYPYCTLFDPVSGISWQVHMFSYGKHAEIEPLTAADTEKMYKACGYQKWTPKPVWVIFADGTIRIATTHSVPHEVQHIRDNNFAGHACLHFPRTMAQVTSIGPYATKHQNAVDKAWAELQASLK